MSNQEFSGRGFLARPLYALPKSIIGRRRYRTPSIPKETEEDYTTALYALLSIPDGEKAQVIRLSQEADQEAERFFLALEARLGEDDGDLAELEGWASKFHGQVMRIAGILHCLEHYQAAEVPVSLDTMLAAQAIGGYFLEHARAAFQMMGITESREEKDARYILRRLLSDGRTKISKRDLIRLCRKFRSAEEMEPGLEELTERGYIRVETVKTGGRGKPPQIIYLNPEAA